VGRYIRGSVSIPASLCIVVQVRWHVDVHQALTDTFHQKPTGTMPHAVETPKITMPFRIQHIGSMSATTVL
jgi:hypothetical protein